MLLQFDDRINVNLFKSIIWMIICDIDMTINIKDHNNILLHRRMQ